MLIEKGVEIFQKASRFPHFFYCILRQQARYAGRYALSQMWQQHVTGEYGLGCTAWDVRCFSILKSMVSSSPSLGLHVSGRAGLEVGTSM